MWQRQLSPAVYQAIDAVRADAAGFAILAVEVSWVGGDAKLFRASLNHQALVASGRPVGLVLRIGPYSGRFAADDKIAQYLKELVVSLLDESRSAGLNPAELQIDFDCASSKLAGYRQWIDVLRVAAAGTKLTFTALPDWLGRADFPALARAADGYVLQVHSLEKPVGPDEIFQLCDPDRAWAWIEKASRIGAPFRVALPTYGYRLAFDEENKFFALAAEGSDPAWPVGTRVQTVSTDPTLMAGLVRKLSTTTPAGCAGIIWFRLPVAGDRLNWDITTLRVLLRGETPASRLSVEADWLSPGLAEVRVVNQGERDESLPKAVAIYWSGDERVQTGDGLGGYALSSATDGVAGVTLTGMPALSTQRLLPGRSRKIGWLRFSHEVSLTVHFASSP